ncbi:MAG: type III pantothenate kinase [Sphaerochaetaceae bacterium]|jgi:type III pantothenate kinase
MLLVVDIGNTNIVLATYHNNEWIGSWRIHSDPKKTGDEYLVIIERMLSDSIKEIDQAVVSSVVPKLTKPIGNVVHSLCSIEPLIVTHDSAVGIQRASIPPELGYDLLANAEAAHHLYPSETCMVLDLGTALTLTTVDSDGNILGVAIAPGLETAVSSLFRNTAQIPSVQLVEPKGVLGRTSEDSIQSGIMYGFSGLVKELVSLTEKELNRKVVLIATGGLVYALAPLIERVDLIEQRLTLEGLRIMATT